MKIRLTGQELLEARAAVEAELAQLPEDARWEVLREAMEDVARLSQAHSQAFFRLNVLLPPVVCPHVRAGFWWKTRADPLQPIGERIQELRRVNARGAAYAARKRDRDGPDMAGLQAQPQC